MSERNLYGSDGQFVGSIDDDDRIYDNRHSFMGRIENGIIYDNCNRPQGHITDGGMVLDNHRQEIGQEYGTGFSSSGPRREMGFARADILSEGHGSDYGAFHLLDRNQRHRYDTYPYDEDDGETDDDDDYGDNDYDNDRDDDIYVPPSRPKRRAGRGKNDEAISHDDPEASCLGCGCIVLFVIGILIVLRLYSGVPFSQW